MRSRHSRSCHSGHGSAKPGWVRNLCEISNEAIGSPAFSGIMNKETGGKLRANVVASVKGRMAKP